MKQSEIAYARFKDAMLQGRLKLGETITQAEVAENLGVQISGLRVAINKLESEGLVRVMPRSGIQLVKPDLSMIRDSYQLRSILEREAIRAFIRRASDSQVAKLLEDHEEVLRRVDEDEPDAKIFKRAMELDSRTHDSFVRALENPQIDDVFKRNEERLALVRMDRGTYRSRLVLKETMQEHLQFMLAVKKRDPEAAVRHLDQHLSTSMKRAMGI